MHVLVVGRGIPSDNAPLNGIFEWDQAKALVAAGLQVDYFAIDLRSVRRLRPWGITHGQQDGVIWHCISIPIGRLPRMLRCKIGVVALKMLYQKSFRHGEGPDVIHAHFTDFGYMAAQLTRNTGTPLVITEHSSNIVKPVISDGVRRIATKAYGAADCVIAVSGALQGGVYRHTGVIAEVVPNIVSMEFHCEWQRHTGMRFVSVGNLNSGKRIDALLLAFAQLCTKHDDIALDVVGDGEMRGSLERLTKELRIGNKVRFHGQLPRQQIMEIFKGSDCFVLPSAFETFGVAYIEAMAAGLPVIATRCGGPEDFVEESNGILVPVDDVDELGNAMEHMYRNLNLYSGETISESIQKRFSGEIVANKLKGIYEEVLSTYVKDR